MPKRFRLGVFVLWSVCFATPAGALTILTEEDPPYNYQGADGKPVGYMVELLAAVQKVVNNHDPVTILPWSRGYKLAQENPDVLLFSMARTLERESLFRWLGPVAQNDWYLYGLAGSPVVPADLNAAKALARIGVARDSGLDQYLTGQRFQNLVRVTENVQSPKMLMAKRLDAYASTDHTFLGELRAAGLNPSDFRPVLLLHSRQVYFAFSKKTDPALVAEWSKALERVKASGLMKQLHEKYFPGLSLPGPAFVPVD